MLIGAHVSIANGFLNALKIEEEIGANCGQIFVHSPRSWKLPSISKKEAGEFRKLMEEKNIMPMMAHASYLINLASPNENIYKLSLKVLQAEIEACEILELRYIILHPGAHKGKGKSFGLKKVVDAINKLKIRNLDLLLENSAAEGSELFYRFEHFKEIFENLDAGFDVNVCIDTQHAFAAGYDVKNSFDEVLKRFNKIVGIEKLKVIHINDSKTDFASKKDRHEHIGLGKIGKDGMEKILNHEKVKDLPFILETPVDEKRGHKENIEFVKSLRK